MQEHIYEGEALDEAQNGLGRVRLAYTVRGRSWSGHIYYDEATFITDAFNVHSVRIRRLSFRIVYAGGGASGSAFEGSGPPPHELLGD